MQHWTVQICGIEFYELQVPTAAYLWIVLAINIMSKADICMLFGYFFMISTYNTVVVIIFRLESTFHNKKDLLCTLFITSLVRDKQIHALLMNETKPVQI